MNHITYIFDIDHTLTAQSFEDEREITTLKPNEPILRIAQSMSKTQGFAIVTARPEYLRAGTLEWLNTHNLGPDILLFRDNTDVRPDFMVRVDQVKRVMREFGNNVILFDDRPDNCKEVGKLGVPCVHVISRHS